jgi:hypothetical protein
MFVISNLSGGVAITINAGINTDLFSSTGLSTSLSLADGSTITLYAVFTGGNNYWVVQA